jgi:putative transposase
MGKAKKHSPEQIVNVLRQIEVAIANGKTTLTACWETGITEQTFYHWRGERLSAPAGLDAISGFVVSQIN